MKLSAPPTLAHRVRTLVVAAALVGADGRIFMQRRRAEAEMGGLWEFPGGKMEAGESPEAALVRELEEELAIAVAPASLVPVACAGNDQLAILLYATRLWTGEPLCLEADALDWVPPEALASLAMPPLDYPLVARLLARLDKGEI